MSDHRNIPSGTLFLVRRYNTFVFPSIHSLVARATYDDHIFFCLTLAGGVISGNPEDRHPVIVDSEGNEVDARPLLGTARKLRLQALAATHRTAPTPGTGTPGCRMRHCLRRMRTTQEVRWRDHGFEEAREMGIRLKGRRRDLPNYWDDFYRGQTRSWKKYRRHQYRNEGR